MTTKASQIPLPCDPVRVDDFLSEPGAGALQMLSNIHSDILVMGAGGKMGLHLCLLLKEGLRRLGRNSTVYAASRFRTLASQEVYQRAGVETLVGDFRDYAFLDSLPKCPVVFYLAGAKFGTSSNPELLQEMNVELPRRVAKRFPNSTIAVFSTGCVYSYMTPESGGSTETSPLEPVGAYAQSCLGREQAFTEMARETNARAILLRINYSVEFRYGVPVDIGWRVLNGEPVDLGMGYVNVIWQNDAINHIVQSIRVAESPPAPLNITGPDIVPVREIAGRFGELFGKEPVFTGKEQPTAWLSNAGRSHRLFGKPAVTLDRMIEWIAAWLDRGLETWNKPTGFERRDGNF